MNVIFVHGIELSTFTEKLREIGEGPIRSYADSLLNCPEIKNDCQSDVKTYLLFASKRKEMTRKNILNFKFSKLPLLSRTTCKHLRANQ